MACRIHSASYVERTLNFSFITHGIQKKIHMTKNTTNTVFIVLFSPRIQYMQLKVKEINLKLILKIHVCDQQKN
jgi:cellobiose-specific phosphotransferase system component IIB